MSALADHPKVVAIGEIGLDFHFRPSRSNPRALGEGERELVSRHEQAQAFRAQLDLAADLGLPVIIHNREASAEITQILDEWASSARTRNSPLARRTFWGVLHAFSGDAALAQAAYGWNFALGLGGVLTFRNARALHSLAPQLCLDRLLLETDAPYLTPHPLRGKRNEPAYVALVAERLAELLAVTVAEVAARTTAVACSIFGIDAGETFAFGDRHSVAADAFAVSNVNVTARLMFASNHDLRLAAVLLIFAGGIATALGYFLSTALSEKIHWVGSAAAAIADGRRDVRVEVVGKDELAQLGHTFNQMAARLEEAERQQRETEQLRRNLLAWIGHDLRTPLASIRALVEALTDGVVTEPTQAQRYLRTITLHSLEELICVVFGIFEFVAPAAECSFGDADDGGEVAPSGAGFGGLFEGFRVVQEFEGVHAGRSLVWQYRILAAVGARPDGG